MRAAGTRLESVVGTNNAVVIVHDVEVREVRGVPRAISQI